MRPKLPAYARQLIERRRAGDHPLIVNVVFGEQWFRVEDPKVCVKPLDYAPRKFSWHCLAGLCAVVVDQVGDLDRFEPHARPQRFGLIYDLLGEIAATDAYVRVQYLGGREQMALELAQIARHYDRARGAMVWPAWWSDETQAKQDRRFELWLADVNKHNNPRPAARSDERATHPA